MPNSHLFTSESVSEGHPDKIADQISDAIVDELIRKTAASRLSVKNVRAGCETLVRSGVVVLAGEMRSDVWVDVEHVARGVIRDIGYSVEKLGFNVGFDAENCAVLPMIGQQSPDIAMGVDPAKRHRQGAGDQGMMFGYACSETPELMPAPLQLAHELMRQHAKVRRRGLLWLGPDAKAQVTMRYEDGRPVEVTHVLLSTLHAPSVGNLTARTKAGGVAPRFKKMLESAVTEEIIEPVLRRRARRWLPRQPRITINPTGLFTIGGPAGDCGLTGRKIIVDTYGGAAPHGGGAFSGKDPTKVDRSAAYGMRHVAKSIVASGLASRCMVQVAYAIGVSEPVSFMVDTFGTGKKSDAEIAKRVRAKFDLTPSGLIDSLDLWRPLYLPTAAYGHFGRSGAGFPWENVSESKHLLLS